MTAELLAFFVGGFLGSTHCIGMCGGFALAIGATKTSFSQAVTTQLIYSLGRIFTYAFLGAAIAAVGQQLSRYTNSMQLVSEVLSVVAGVTMLLVGLGVLFGVGLEFFNKRLSGLAGVITRLLRPFMQCYTRWPGRRAFLLAGVFTGFLPCGLLYAFLAMAMAKADIGRGMLAMVAFGLGTVPAMVAFGCGGSLAGTAARAKVHKVAACFVALLGIATIARGLPFIPCDLLVVGGHAGSSCCH